MGWVVGSEVSPTPRGVTLSVSGQPESEGARGTFAFMLGSETGRRVAMQWSETPYRRFTAKDTSV